jgi:CRP-like cAMP-binding protein
MNSDRAIVNLSRALPASNRPTPGGLGAVAQGKHHHLTAHLPQNLRSVSTLQWLQAGDYLFRRGDVVDAAYQVVQGSVGLSCGLPSCEAAPPLLLGAGEYLVESGAVHGHNAIFYGKSGAALRIPLHAFHAVLLKDGSFAAAFGMQMAERAQHLHRQSERLNLKSAEERLCHYLMTESDDGSGQVTLSGTYGTLAGELRIAHETLCRLLKSMSAQGRIQRDGRTLRLTRHP